MNTYINFCTALCSDEDSKNLINKLVVLPDEVTTHILDLFSTHTLAKKIHPIQSDDIFMASHREYREFYRRSHGILGRVINRSTMETLARIRDVSNAFSPYRGSQHDISTIIYTHLGFPPSKKFLRRWTFDDN